jgi:hypothetical protein
MLTGKSARVTSAVHYAINRCTLFVVFFIQNLQRLWCLLIQRCDVGDEMGEGVISTAIVVMIMAFLAVGLWVAFKLILHNATSSISTQVSQIGQ